MSVFISIADYVVPMTAESSHYSAQNERMKLKLTRAAEELSELCSLLDGWIVYQGKRNGAYSICNTMGTINIRLSR